METKLTNVTEHENNNPNIDKIRNEIKQYYNTKQAETVHIRPKENGVKKVKINQVFLDLEKHSGKSKLWKKIKTPDGKYDCGIENILNRQVEFYEILFKRNEENANILLNNIDAKLPEDDVKNLESAIAKDEHHQAMKSMTKRKSPGEYVIVMVFYEMFWHIKGDDFTTLVQEIFRTKKLSDSQWKGLITLIHKQGKEKPLKTDDQLHYLN
jgi:hypothetical protein